MKEEPLSRARPMLDMTFKAIFGREGKEHLLLSLLNSVLERPGFVRLTEVEYLNQYLDYEGEGEKHPAVDVRVRDQLGRQFNVEVQIGYQKTWPQRMLYYWSKMYAHQLLEGEKYVDLNPAICLVFLGFALDKREGYMRRVVAWDETHGVAFSEHLDLVLFEMPKFLQADLEKVSDERERWLCFLKEGQTMATDVVERWKTPEIIEAMEELKKLSKDRAWRERYNDREKALRDYISMMTERFEEGREEGRDRGYF
jgi:predicted transposase/invertase (TIGR01784 family)